ncbi:MAG: sulfite exporter TauE/SafE family protein [Candidatus Bathyarchaeia archaeon]
MLSLALVLAQMLVGIFAGFFGALLGFGGGVFIVPILTLYLGVPIHQAIASSIVSVIATSNAGGSSYVEQRITNVRLAVFLEVCTTAGALTGSLLALFVSGGFLFLAFSLLLAYLAVAAFRTRRLDEARLARNVYADAAPKGLARWLDIRGSYFDQAEAATVDYRVAQAGAGSLLSYIAGVGSGLLGIGGGVVKVTAMNLYMNVPVKAAIGTSKFMIGVTAATSALVFLASGILDPFTAAPICIGTTLGATVGTWAMNRLNSRTLKLSLTVLMAYLGYAMAAQGLALYLGLHLPTLSVGGP